MLLLSWTHSDKFFLDGDSSLVINQASGFISTTAYLKVVTTTGAVFNRTLNIEVCGFESIRVDPVDLDFTYTPENVSTNLSISMKDYPGLFIGSYSNCPIVTYAISSRTDLVKDVNHVSFNSST